MSSQDEAAARYALARQHLADIASDLIALRLEDNAEARAFAVAKFMERTRWPERTATLAIEAELRNLKLTPDERDAATARLLIRIHEAGLEPLKRAP